MKEVIPLIEDCMFKVKTALVDASAARVAPVLSQLREMGPFACVGFQFEVLKDKVTDCVPVFLI